MDTSKIPHVHTEMLTVLAKLREISNQSKVFSNTHTATALAPPTPASIHAPTVEFNNVLNALKEGVNQVGQLQSQSEKLNNAYLLGDPNVSMSSVVVATEKSKLAFEGLITIRNKLLEAYKEIMNMPV